MLPYTQEKRHAEEWCKKYADAGHGCIAARWGGKLLSILCSLPETAPVAFPISELLSSDDP